VTGEKLDEKHFKIKGVTNLAKEDGTFSFFYKGDINQITKLVGGGKLVDLTIEDLTLEEIFMHYYE
jgi:ABC-2 type transport system ATP-binding protein